MTSRVLVAYASKYGATLEIAEKIGEVLRGAGFKVNVLPADQVHELAPFGAVVLGSALYTNNWRIEALKFLEENAVFLENVPVWLFSSGLTGEVDHSTPPDWRFPSQLQPVIDHICPREIATFRGALDMNKLNFAEKLIVKESKAPIGDFRDWEVITAWASRIASALQT
jgi:menaquinone-dependent protoporphyrinogen oxidase